MLLLLGLCRDQAGRSVTDERAVTWANPAAVQISTPCLTDLADRVLACRHTRSGRRLDGIDYRRLPINSNNKICWLEMLLSQPASQPAYYCTASPRCYSVLSPSVSCLCFCAGCSSNNTLIGASTDYLDRSAAQVGPVKPSLVLLCIPERDRSLRYGIFGPPATRSNPAARPSAPAPQLPFSLRRRRLTMRGPRHFGAHPPLKQQTGSGATAKAEAKTKAGGMNDVTQSHAWQFGLFGQFAAHFSST